jgi:hypothetical protein
MGFFDNHHAKTEAPEQPTLPDWFAPPSRILGRPLSESIVMLVTEKCAVVLTQFVAYPSGLAWDISVRFIGHFAGNRHHLAWEGPDRAMYGIELSDGTPVLPHQPEEWPPVARPEGTVLSPRGGSGDDSGITFSVWLNPLPTESFRVIFAWEAAGIKETKAEIDITELAEAASKSIELWPAQNSAHV